MDKLKKYYKYVFITVVLLTLFIGGVVVKADSSNTQDIEFFDSDFNNEITVEIIGEVKYPGKYTVKQGTKIKEIFYIVGGLLENSDTSLINLNETLNNNDIIMVNKSMKKNNRININTASIQELTKLTGIGQKKAEQIVLYRKTHGSFKTIQDLEKVEGISEKIIIDIIDEITLS